MDESLLLWGLLFSMIGLGFFIYGRKQKAMAPLALRPRPRKPTGRFDILP
jgi:hypothetical protein